MEISIRDMKTTDWDDVKRIYTQGLEEGRSTFETQCPSYTEWNANHIQECRYVAVAYNKVIGWVAISPTSSRDCYKGVVSLSIYIDHDYRSMGIGKRLLNHLCSESEKRGYWCLYSGIFSQNEASLELHRSCGFRRIGYREKIAKDRFGNWQDTVLMERRTTYR